MASLTNELRGQLYLIAWQGDEVNPKWLKPAQVEALLAQNLVQKTAKGYVATDTGRSSLSSMARTACQRPKDYGERSPEDQWAIDKGLGILDWDGD